jgi:hypothetical protein
MSFCRPIGKNIEKRLGSKVNLEVSLCGNDTHIDYDNMVASRCRLSSGNGVS